MTPNVHHSNAVGKGDQAQLFPLHIKYDLHYSLNKKRQFSPTPHSTMNQ